MTRQQKILGGILAGGVLLVGSDRLFFGSTYSGPAATAASDMAGEEAPAGENQAKPSSLDELARLLTVHQGPSLAERLDRVVSRQATPASSRNAFAQPGTWFPAAGQPDSKQAKESGPRTPAESFIQSHQLRTVMEQGAQSVAVVNDRPVKVGESLDGLRLVEVGRRRAVFETDAGTRAVLLLQARPAGP